MLAPPLEPLGLLLSNVAIVDHSQSQNNARSHKALMINDVSRAFFEVPMQRDLCIELPDDDRSEEHDERRFGT